MGNAFGQITVSRFFFKGAEPGNIFENLAARGFKVVYTTKFSSLVVWFSLFCPPRERRSVVASAYFCQHSVYSLFPDHGSALSLAVLRQRRFPNGLLRFGERSIALRLLVEEPCPASVLRRLDERLALRLGPPLFF